MSTVPSRHRTFTAGHPLSSGRAVVTAVTLALLTLAAVPSASALSDTAAVFEDEPRADVAMVRPGSVFEVYADNRERGLPSYVTADLPLLGYALLREHSIVELEETRIRPAFGDVVTALGAALDDPRRAAEAPEATARNRDLVALLSALLASDPGTLAGESLAEYERVLAAVGPAPSAMWSRTVDYSQYAPRGRYAGDSDLEGFFRAMRYAGSQLFAVTASGASGVDVAASRLQTRQAVQLVRLVDEEPAVGDPHALVESALAWQFGTSRELGTDDWLDLIDAHATGEDAHDVDDTHDGNGTHGSDDESLANAASVDALRAAVLARARDEDRQPRVFDAVVDLSRLEPALTVPDVLTGWRLFGARESAQTSAAQRLLFPGTGRYEGPADDHPFGLGTTGGQPVKAFPTARETLALLEPGDVRGRLDAAHESAFAGYDEAFDAARERLDAAAAAEALHLGILRAGLHALDGREAPERESTLLAFDACHRYLDVLYARQSYSPVSKSLRREPARAGADLEPAAELYHALAVAARAQARQTGIAAWERYAAHLDRLQGIAFARGRVESLDADDEAFLNRLDRLLQVEGVSEAPVIVDVHTDPESRQVVQRGSGLPVLVQHGEARGARSSFHEFKQPLDERLVPAAWRQRLDGSAPDEPIAGDHRRTGVPSGSAVR